MKFYIASRVKNKKLVESIHQELTNKGHTFVSDWVKEGNITPYEDHPKNSEKLAIQCVDAINNCDVFILISDESGSGMYTEFGVALQITKESAKPKIFVIGEYNNSCVFFFHPLVKQKKNLEEVLNELGI